MKIRVGTIIFVSSFILQLIVMYLSGGYRQPELYEYKEIAVNLLMKHTFLGHRLGAACYSLLAPLYPFLCAITYLLTDYSHLAMLLVQITLTSLICVIIYLVGKEVFNKKTGIIGAIFCIFHPGLIIYSTTKLHDLVLVAFMFCLLVLTVLKFEKDLSFLWSAIPVDVFDNCGRPEAAKNQTANMFFGSTREGDFGILMVEEEKNKLMVSFRSAGRFNTEKIARELGGGGHRDSSAAVIEGLQFDQAVEKVLTTAREIVKNEKKYH